MAEMIRGEATAGGAATDAVFGDSVSVGSMAAEGIPTGDSGAAGSGVVGAPPIADRPADRRAIQSAGLTGNATTAAISDRPTPRDTGPVSHRRSRRSGWPYVVALLTLDGIVIAWVWPTLTRPFWYDEAWRAYHLSVGQGWFAALRSANAPLPLGWFLLERAFLVTFGNTPFVLRLPEILALPACTLLTYLLGRWWLARPAAALAAAALTVNGSLIVYGLQLKSYLPEAACAAGVVHLWLRARQASEQGRSPLWAQLGMAVCGVTALSSLFLLAPLLLIDLADAVAILVRPRPGRGAGTGAGGRRRGSRRSGSRRRVGPLARLPGALLVAAASVAHLVLFVLPQSYLTGNPYWQGFFLDSSTWASRLGTAGADLATRSTTAALTRPDGQFGSPFTGSPLLSGPAGWIVAGITAGLLICWAAGIVAASRSRNGPALLAALIGAIVSIVIAGSVGQWPVGFVRANLFLLPPLYVLAAVGAARLVRATGRVPAGQWASGGVALIWVGFVIFVGATRIEQIRSTADDPLLLGAMDKLVAVEKADARPGDIQIVVSGRRDLTQWYKPQEYYAFYADGTRGGIPVANRDTLLLEPATWAGSIAAFLPHHPHAGALFLVTYNHVSGENRSRLVGLLRARGWCESGPTSTWQLTGELSRLTPCRS